jgi:uncharacterized repeat protein (TIGR01451 family)
MLLVCLLATALPAAAADPASADVSLDLRDASGSAGQSMSYGPAVSNAGPATATVVVTVQLASGLEFVRPASGCSTSGSTITGWTVTCTIGSIPAGAGAALAWELRAAEPGTYAVTGSVTGDQSDPALGNNIDSAQIVIAPSPADVSIDLQNASARAGEAFSYTFTVANAGPGSATNVVATIELPTGMELVSEGTGSCVQSGRNVTCSLGTMLARTIAPIRLTLRAADAGTYTVLGSVTAAEPDGFTPNNSDSGTITVTPSADVAVAVSDSMDPVKPGQGVTYTTTVTNQGPSAASNVMLSETWSASTSKDLSVGRVTTSGGTCAVVGMRLDCQLGTLASGESATVTIALKPRGGGSVTLNANASATEFDPDASNNSDTESTAVGPK